MAEPSSYARQITPFSAEVLYLYAQGESRELTPAEVQRLEQATRQKVAEIQIVRARADSPHRGSPRDRPPVDRQRIGRLAEALTVDQISEEEHLDRRTVRKVLRRLKKRARRGRRAA